MPQAWEWESSEPPEKPAEFRAPGEVLHVRRFGWTGDLAPLGVCVSCGGNVRPGQPMDRGDPSTKWCYNSKGEMIHEDCLEYEVFRQELIREARLRDEGCS